jgi:hypothetical protein
MSNPFKIFERQIAEEKSEIKEKDAEIERLAASLGEKLADLTMAKEFITELCDALDIMTQFLLISDLPLELEETKRREIQALIQRAREATR